MKRIRVKIVDFFSPICSLYIVDVMRSSSHSRLLSYETNNHFSDLLPAASGDLRPPPFQPPCLPVTKWKPVNRQLEELASQPDVKQPQPSFLNRLGDWTGGEAGKLQSWNRDKNLEPTSCPRRSTETREEDWGVTKTQVEQISKKIIWTLSTQQGSRFSDLD